MGCPYNPKSACDPSFLSNEEFDNTLAVSLMTNEL